MYPSTPLAPVRNLGTAANALILAVCATNIYSTWTDWNTYSVVTDYVDDVPGVGEADLYAADNATTVAFVVGLIALVAAGIVFLTWLTRARANAERMNNVQHRMSRGWTVGAWFCPIVNLWFPRRIVDDIWRASRPGVPADQYRVDGLPLSPLVRVWWFLMIADYLVQLLARFEARREFTAETLLSQMKTIAVYTTISTVFSIAAAVVLIKVMRQLVEWQSAPRPAADGLSQQQA